ncbi:phosphoethanolamine transferase [Shewanella electrodiphila]|uniref:Phosphoethanolamine transferase n=1 Tax=Shewanella electrodiphila TaxID=934143 RepID=A0ABT0KRE8_9GAMM|nr:phosphoethanolamine transferase [Shewanella electrodiphila]MCL1046328.1 phosphoethanolamine transferase [Shewanella electrodiphila]
MEEKNKVLNIAFIYLIIFIPDILLMYLGHVNLTGIVASLTFLTTALIIINRISWFYITALPWLLISPLESWYVWHFQTPSNEHIIGVLLETNLREILELSSYKELLLYILYLLFLLIKISSNLCYKSNLLNKEIVKAKVSSIGLSVLTIICLLLEINVHASSTDNFLKSTSKFGESFLVGTVAKVISAYKELNQISKLNEYKSTFSFNAQKDFQGEEVHVLMIGETSRFDRWHLNGYKRETNPLLETIDEIISFQDINSNWSLTRNSVPTIITRKNPQNETVLFNEKSIISAFTEAGFKSYWLSNQSYIGEHDSIISTYASEASEKSFINTSPYNTSSKYDIELVTKLSEILKSNGSKFIVMHLLGSHHDYNDRYPEQFNVYSPSNYGNKTNLYDIRNINKLNNAYDNTILYTDFIIYKTIKLLEELNIKSSITYASDHGESLFDDGISSGHGLINKKNFHVPLFLWHSKKLIKYKSKKISNAKKNVKKPLTNSFVFQSLLDIANIKIDNEDKNFSYYHMEPKSITRIVQGQYSYDNLE